MVPHSTRDANPARLRKSLQTGRDIDGVAEEIVALNDDVTDVDADPKPHLLGDRSISIRAGSMSFCRGTGNQRGRSTKRTCNYATLTKF